MAVSPTRDGEATLWEAVAEHAATWADFPLVRRFAAELPRNASQRSHGLSGELQHVAASGGTVSSRPLRLGTNVPQILSIIPGGGPPPAPSPVLEQWLKDAVRVELVHRMTVAWLRSRLPRYPQLPAPQLAPGTPLTTQEFTYRLPWNRADLAAGLQFQNPPSEPLRTLGATDVHAARAVKGAQRVALALADMEQWHRLREADAALSPTDRAELVAARRAIANASKPEAVDAHEPHRALPRDAYRGRVVADVVGGLTGAAREYADAFDAADQFVELSCSDVFGQLAVYGTVPLADVSDLASHGLESVEFAVADRLGVELGAVCWLNDPLFPDAVHVTGFTLSFDQATGGRLLATGRRLFGTATVWPRPAT